MLRLLVLYLCELLHISTTDQLITATYNLASILFDCISFASHYETPFHTSFDLFQFPHSFV